LLEAEAEGNESEQVICQVTSLSQPLSAISLSSHNPPTQVYYALRPDGSCGPVHAASSTNATWLPWMHFYSVSRGTAAVSYWPATWQTHHSHCILCIPLPGGYGWSQMWKDRDKYGYQKDSTTRAWSSCLTRREGGPRHPRAGRDDLRFLCHAHRLRSRRCDGYDAGGQNALPWWTTSRAAREASSIPSMLRNHAPSKH